MNWLGRVLSGGSELGFYALLVMTGLGGFGVAMIAGHRGALWLGAACGILTTAGFCGFAVFIRDHEK